MRKVCACGHELVFCRSIRRGGRVIRPRKPKKFFVFCPRRGCTHRR